MHLLACFPFPLSSFASLQNLVDSLAQRYDKPIPLERHAELKTFVVFNKRRRVTSSAKRKRLPGSTAISQTPDGSFLDLMRNSQEVLQRCGFTTPEVGNHSPPLPHRLGPVEPSGKSSA